MLVPLLSALRSYAHQTVPLRLDIADGTGVPVPPERAGCLAVLSGALEEQGFVPLSTVAPASPGGTIYACVLVHPDDATRAWAIDAARGSIVHSYVELVTEWEDGAVVSTVNHGNPRIFEPLERVVQLQLPGASVATTVARHRERCAEIPGRRLDPSQRDPVEVAQEQNREVLAHQERCGILRRRGEDYGFTWHGAWRSNVRLWRAMRSA
jgi:hypothetical protein